MSLGLENHFFLLYDLARQRKIPPRFVYQRGELIDGYGEIIELLKTNSLIQVFDFMKLVINISHQDISYIYFENSNKSVSIVVSQINAFYNMLNSRIGRQNIPHVELEGDTISGYLEWKELFMSETLEEAESLSNYTKYLSLVANTPAVDVPIDETFISNFTLELYISILGKRVESSDGFTIFNKAVPSRTIPFIQWNNASNQKRIKAYEDLDLSSFSHQEILTPNIFAFNFDTIHNKNKKKINYKSIINLEKGVLQIDIPSKIGGISIEDSFIKAFLEAFPGVEIEGKRRANIDGYFNIMIPKNVDFPVLQYIIMNNVQFRNFYFRDATKTRLDRGKFECCFRGFIGTKNYYGKQYISSSAGVNLAFDTTFEKGGQTFQKIMIKKAVNFQELNSFQAFFKILMGFYFIEQNYEKVKDLFAETIYTKFFSGGKARSISSASNISRTMKLGLPISKNQLLKQESPEMFSFNNARVTSCKKQPIIISETDVEDWKNLLVGGKERDILFFPGGDIKSFYFVCPNDDLPYIALKPNSIPSKNVLTDEMFVHLEKYPLIIECVKTKTNISTKKPKTQKVNKGTHVTKTFKIRRFGDRGEIVPDLRNLFKLVSPDSEPLLEGVDVSNYSFIEAMMLSEEHDFSEDQEERLDSIQIVKRDIIETVRPEVYMQELYDLSVFGILSKLENDDYFDSELFVRGLEEYFETNILIFRPKILKKGIKTNEKSEIVIETPRNYEYHVRNYNPKRKTVCLFKTMGSESDGDVRVPHYQFISGLPETTDFTHEIYKFVNLIEKTLIWSFDYREPSGYQDLNCRLNPSNHIMWNNILDEEIIFSQFIDGYGKTRIVNIVTPEEPLSIVTIPVAPLNVKMGHEIYYGTSSNVRDIFGKPSGINEYGYWYPMLDYEYGFFIPIKNISESSTPEVPKPPINLLKKGESSSYGQYSLVKKSSKILIELVEWCWRWDTSEGGLDEWWARYIKTGEDDISYSKPILKNIDIFFPFAEDTDTAIESLHKWWPDIFTIGRQNKILLSRDLNQSLYNYFVYRDRQTKGLENAPSKYVTSFYESDSDYNSSETSIVFVDDSKFKQWLDMKTKVKNNNISDKIDIENIGMEPYLYTRDSKIYMIQKLNVPTIQNAVMISAEWVKTGINQGYYFNDQTLNNRDELPPFGEYQIDEDKLIPVSDFTYGLKDYHSIINYGGTLYAAMLPLL